MPCRIQQVLFHKLINKPSTPSFHALNDDSQAISKLEGGERSSAASRFREPPITVSIDSKKFSIVGSQAHGGSAEELL